MNPKNEINILYFAPCGAFEGMYGSARIKDMVNIFTDLNINTQLVSFIPSDKFKIEHNFINNKFKTCSILIPQGWPKILKGSAIILIILYGFRYIKNSNLVLSHSPSIVSGFPAFILAKIFNKPIVIDHGDINDLDTPNFIYKMILKKSTHVLAISKFLEEDLEKNFQKKAQYLPIFTDTELFNKSMYDPKKIRKQLNLSENDFVIGYAGSFYYVEGIPNLINAFNNLSKIHKNMKLLIIGGKKASNSDNIEKMVKELSLTDKVIIIPPVKHSLIPEYLSACNILCAPKIDCEVNRACNPVKVIEYLSMGIPCVCSCIGEIILMIDDGIDGLLVIPGNINDLETKIELLYLNPDLSAKLGFHAREKAINKYSYQVVKKSIENLIAKIETVT